MLPQPSEFISLCLAYPLVLKESFPLIELSPNLPASPSCLKKQRKEKQTKRFPHTDFRHGGHHKRQRRVHKTKRSVYQEDKETLCVDVTIGRAAKRKSEIKAPTTWKDGSVVRSNCCSSTGHGFSSRT